MTEQEREEFTDAAYVIGSYARKRNENPDEYCECRSALYSISQFVQSLSSDDLSMFFMLLLSVCKHENVRSRIIEITLAHALHYSSPNEVVQLVDRIKDYANHSIPEAHKLINKAIRKGYGRNKEPQTAQYLLYARNLQKQFYARGEEPDMKAILKKVNEKYPNPKKKRTLSGLKSQLSRHFGKSKKKANDK